MEINKCEHCNATNPTALMRCYRCTGPTRMVETETNPPVMAGSVVGQSVDATLAERGKRYGKFTGHAQVSQRLKDVIYYALASEGRSRLADDQKEALDMICHKMARIVNGDPNYADSWHDIAGYAKLVEDRLNGISK